jgi:electron transport complex protein RnfG
MVLVLFLVTFVAGLSLAMVYNVTKDPIEKAKQAKKKLAIQDVLPEFSNEPATEKYSMPAGKDSLVVYPGKKNGKTVAYAVQTFTNQGFSGTIKLMVGFLPDGTIHDIKVLEHKETPGLGDKIEKSKSDFTVQFQGKNPGNFKLEVKKDGGDVDAITASTITSRAFCDAVKKAYKALKENGAFTK